MPEDTLDRRAFDRLVPELKSWGRWGDEDELGTLNHLVAECRTDGARQVQSGEAVSLSIEFGASGPQTGAFNRFNPIHLMTRDGSDAAQGVTKRDFYPPDTDLVHSGCDDIVIMPLQCATHWDALGHVAYEGQIYGGFSAAEISSAGARRLAITSAADRLVGRGVLLDLAAFLGGDPLAPGRAVTDRDLEACLAWAGADVKQGDIVFVRTGHLEASRARGWAGFAGGPAPGIGLTGLEWFLSRQVAAVATDTWGWEVIPSEFEGVGMPLHVLGIYSAGLWFGEIFDLSGLSRACQRDGRFTFFASAQPIPFEKAVGGPVHPLAVR